jgi:Lar family restriction alleviation protein
MEPEYLKPCPFCGAIAESLEIKGVDWRKYEKLFNIPHETNPVFYGVSCRACNAGGPTADSKREAFRLWNERSPNSQTNGPEPRT